MTSILGYPKKDTSATKQIDDKVSAAKKALFPAGSVYITVVNVNPASFLDFGQWASLGSGTITIGGVASSKAVYVWERTS